MTRSHWSHDTIFYHIYPLGMCAAPMRNDFSCAPVPRLQQVSHAIPYLLELGVNGLYLGPLFESSAHGYDTADYYTLDRRLGVNQDLQDLSHRLHQSGIRLILDGVFNHVGRDFWAFRDVQKNLSASNYSDWFENLRFDLRSPYGDLFAYEGWNGHYDLVKLNLKNPDVRQHLLGAVRHWILDFGIDGLRLDVADCLDLDFQKELAAFCRELKPDFWLMGEVVHGDYRRWANPETLDSVTNYECYKGLYSSLLEKNYFEIAYALNRQFSAGGLYNGLPLYNFVDNHDVNRVASMLTNPAHLYPLYCLLFSMPGTPSIYYGSEWGLAGKRAPGDDSPLRPALTLSQNPENAPQPNLPAVIQKLARVRQASPALRRGDYRQLHVNHQQLAFSRQTDNDLAIVLLNAAETAVSIEVPVSLADGSRLVDVLNDQETFVVTGGRLKVEALHPYWARILRLAS